MQGQPARDVKLSVTAIRRSVPDGPHTVREKFEGPAFQWTHPDDLPGWPSPVITGIDGWFALHGVGPGLRVFVSVVDPRFTNQVINIDTDSVSSRKPVSIALQPARAISGRVTYADTGKAVPNTQVIVSEFDQFQIGVGARPIITAADDGGRFRACTGPGTDGVVAVYPPEGQPYLPSVKEVNWAKGAVTHSADLALPRGVMLRGKVSERGSGRPVAGATVSFFPRRNANEALGLVASASRPMQSTMDEWFALPVPAIRGCLMVRGPTEDFVLQEYDRGLLFNGQPEGPRVYSHAFVTCEPKSVSVSPDVEVALRRGITVKGKVVGPDGQPVPEVWMLSRLDLNRRSPLFRGWLGDYHGTARNGQFELHGIDPESEVAVSFFEPKRKLGATARFSSKLAGGEPIVIKLEPCATASMRLIGRDGKPYAGLTPRFLVSMVVTPGAFSPFKARQEGTPLADQDTLTDIDPTNHPKDPTSDAQGQIVLHALISGATYRIVDRTTSRTPGGPQLRKEFTVKPGETLDLGDILIEKPQPL